MSTVKRPNDVKRGDEQVKRTKLDSNYPFMSSTFKLPPSPDRDLEEHRVRRNTMPSMQRTERKATIEVPREEESRLKHCRSDSELVKYLTASVIPLSTSRHDSDKSILESLLTNDVPNLAKLPHWARSGENLQLLAEIVTERARTDLTCGRNKDFMVKSSSTRSLDSGYDSYSSLPKNSSATLRELLQGEQVGAKSLPCNLDRLATVKAGDKNSERRQSLEGGGFGVKFFLENDDDDEEETGILCKVCAEHRTDKQFCVECTEFFNETISNRVRYACTCPQKCLACKLKKCFESGLKYCEPTSLETGYIGNLLRIEPPDRRADNVNDDLTEIFIKLYNKVLLDNIDWAKSIPKFDKLSQEEQICFLESSWMELLSWECIWRSRVHAGEYVQFATDLIFDRRKCEDGGVGGNLTPLLFDLSEKVFEFDVSKEEYVLLKVIILVNGRIKNLPHCTINDDVVSALDNFTKRKFGNGSAKRISDLFSLLPHIRQLSQNAIARLYEAKNDSNLPICDLLKDILSEKSCK